MSKLFLVTGAGGHLGNHIVRQLLAQGERVRVLLLPDVPAPALDGLDVERFWGDVRHDETLSAFFDVPEGAEVTVIHAAAIVSIASRYLQAVHDVNVGGVKTIVDRCLRHGVRRLVHVSSVHAIPEKPHGQVMTEVDHFSVDSVHGLYAQTKAEASQIVLDAVAGGLDAVILHPSGLIGPNDYQGGHTTQLLIDYCNGKLPVSVKGSYDFADARDAAAGVCAAARQGRRGECYILSNKPVTIPEILALAGDIGGLRHIRAIPIGLARIVAPPAELYYRLVKQPPLFTNYSMYTLRSNCLFSHEKASRELGYAPRPLRETIYDTMDWLQTVGRIRLKNGLRRL